jgi:hypothetical protein
MALANLQTLESCVNKILCEAQEKRVATVSDLLTVAFLITVAAPVWHLPPADASNIMGRAHGQEGVDRGYLLQDINRNPAALAAELESLIAPPATGRVAKGEQRRLGRPHRFSNHHQPRRRTPEEISEQSQDAQAGVLVKTRHSIVMESEDCFDLTGGAIPSANPDHFVRSFNPVPP